MEPSFYLLLQGIQSAVSVREVYKVCIQWAECVVPVWLQQTWVQKVDLSLQAGFCYDRSLLKKNYFLDHTCLERYDLHVFVKWMTAVNHSEYIRFPGSQLDTRCAEHWACRHWICLPFTTALPLPPVAEWAEPRWHEWHSQCWHHEIFQPPVDTETFFKIKEQFRKSCKE